MVNQKLCKHSTIFIYNILIPGTCGCMTIYYYFLFFWVDSSLPRKIDFFPHPSIIFCLSCSGRSFPFSSYYFAVALIQEWNFQSKLVFTKCRKRKLVTSFTIYMNSKYLQIHNLDLTQLHLHHNIKAFKCRYWMFVFYRKNGKS